MIRLITPKLSIILKSIVIFFTPIKWLVFLVALSTIVDTSFGIWKAKKLNESVNSKKFRHGFVPKLISYICLVLITYTSDFHLLNELTKEILSIDYLSTKLLSLALIINEVVSMDESFEKVKGYSFIKKIFKTLLRFKDIKKKLAE